MKVPIDSPNERPPSLVIRECRDFLTRLCAGLQAAPLERGHWALPPAGPTRGGYWFRPALSEGIACTHTIEAVDDKTTRIDFSVRPSEADLANEQWRQNRAACAEKLAAHVPEDEREGILGRLELAVTPKDKELRLTLDQMSGPPPRDGWDVAQRIHSMCVQAFRFELQERIIVALDDMPIFLRLSPEACIEHLRLRQPECPALLPAASKRDVLRLMPTDIAVHRIASLRDVSVNKAAQEMALFENAATKPVDWGVLGVIDGAMMWIDKLRHSGHYPDFYELRRKNESHSVIRRAEKIAQDYKDHRTRGSGWNEFNLDDPLEVLLAKERSGPGEFTLAVLTVVSGGEDTKDLRGFIDRILAEARVN